MTDTKQSRLTATLLCVTPPDEHQEQGIFHMTRECLLNMLLERDMVA